LIGGTIVKGRVLARVDDGFPRRLDFLEVFSE
jgi:hypothetical protein